MKKIFRFINWLFGNRKPIIEKTEELVRKEISEIQEIKKSVKDIRVIHEEISVKVTKCTEPNVKKELVLNPRLTTNQLKHYFKNNGVLEIGKMSRKEKQFYAKKIYFLRYRRGMNIIFDKKNKAYKIDKNV
jgi:hypothetical protein